MSRKKSNLRETLKLKIIARNKEKAADRKGTSALSLPNDMSIIEVKKGTRYFDIIPYEVTESTNPSAKKGELWYERTYFRHGQVGLENKTIVCPARTIKESCPICEHRNILLKDYDKNESEIKATKTSERQIFNVIDVEKPDDGVQILDISYFCFGEVLDNELLEDEEHGVYPDLENGLTIKTRFKNESIGNFEFPKASRIDFEKRDPYEDSILEEVANLDTILNILSYKEIKALFFETGENLEEEEEEPKQTRRRSRKKPEEEVEEEEVEEEEPKRTRRRSRKKPEEEVEEEEPKQTRRRSRKKPEEEEEEEDTNNNTDDYDNNDNNDDSLNEPENPENPENSCPQRYIWGQDNDSTNHCLNCAVWDACKDEQEFQEAKKSE